MLILDVSTTIKQIAISLDNIIYSSITWMYSVFTSIAGAKIFSSALVSEFVNRMYLIVSIVMLFIVAYSFMTVIINPDTMSKGNTSPVKIVTNIVLSLVIILITPAMFSFGFAFQKSVVRENVIGKLVLGSTYEQDVNTFDYNSSNFSSTLFETNFYLLTSEAESGLNATDFEAFVTKFENTQIAARYNGSIGVWEQFVSEEQDKMQYVQYNYFVSGVVGIFVLYTLLIFSIDMGLRVVKLFFYEMVAPIPALLMIIPGQDKVVKTWFKQVIKTYIDVFIKIVIITFGVFIINVIAEQFDSGKVVGFESTSQSVILFAKLFIFLGVVMFMRRAPKLIEELLGFKLDENGFSLKKRLDESGVTALLGGAGGMIAGAYSSVKGAKARGGNRFAALGSGLFHGARLGTSAGWKGNLKGIGSAYNYGWANQQAWSHMDSEGGIFHKLHNGVRVAGEMLRDNYGMQSYYEDLIDQARIKHDVQVSKNNRKIQEYEKRHSEKARELENEFKFDERSSANAAFMEKASKASDTSKAEIAKEGYIGETEAYVPVWDNALGKNVIKKMNIRGSQIPAYRDRIDDCLSKHEITDEQHKYLLTSLGNAEKMLGINYDTNTLLSLKRDAGVFSGISGMAGIHPGGSSAADMMYDSYVDSYKKNMRQQLIYDSSSDTFMEYDNLSSTQKAIQDAKWGQQADALFNDIVFNNVDKYKTNVSHANELLGILDQASLAQGSKDDKGYIRDAAGQTVDASGNFVVSSDVLNISKDINNIISGFDISKAVKSVKTQDVVGERDSKYRSTPINVGGNTFNMAQISQIVKSLRDENSKLAKDLETAQLAYQSDKQTSEAARKIGGFGKNGGPKGG